MMKYPWFAVQVRTRGESLVDSLLRGKAYETFLPTYLECRQYSDRIKKIDTALFPGYLFCRCDPDDWLPIVKTPGVQRVVSFSDRPVPVDEGEIETIERLVRAPAAAHPWPYLKAGDRVRVEVGAFSGVEGILVSEKGADRLVVSVTLLQRSVAVEIDRTWLRPVHWSGYYGSGPTSDRNAAAAPIERTRADLRRVAEILSRHVGSRRREV